MPSLGYVALNALILSMNPLCSAGGSVFIGWTGCCMSSSDSVVSIGSSEELQGYCLLAQDLIMRLSGPLSWHRGSWLDWVSLGGSARGGTAAGGTKRPWGSWSGADCSAGCTVGDGRLWGRCWPALNENPSWLGLAGIRDDAVRSWGVEGERQSMLRVGLRFVPYMTGGHSGAVFSTRKNYLGPTWFCPRHGVVST